jgi:hypothetical protein
MFFKKRGVEEVNVLVCEWGLKGVSFDFKTPPKKKKNKSKFSFFNPKVIHISNISL